MDSGSSPSIQYVTVTCKLCGTRVDEHLSEKTREVKCPDCHRPVSIPGRDELPAAPITRPTPDPGVYGLRRDALPGAPQPASKRPRNSLGDVLVICPICNARLHPPLRPASYKVRCPDCLKPVRVPTPEEAAIRDERTKPRPLKLAPLESLPIPAAQERRLTSAFFSLQTVQIRREVPDPPPEWVWFSGVWTFPWEPDVLKKWGFLSLGLTLLGGLIALLLSLFGGASSPASAVMAFFALPMVWIFLWTAAYGTSACLHIITETAAGNQRIGDWPDQGWRDGMFAFLPIIYVLGIAAFMGHLIGLGTAAAGMNYSLSVCVVVGGLLPYLVLSMLETGAWYFPFSGPVTRSLWRNGRDWGMAYVLLAVLLGGCGWVWVSSLQWSLIGTVLLTGFLWTTVLLISARLIGRLAWRITHALPDEEAS